MPQNNLRAYTTIDVAKRLGVSLQTVQRWVDAGHLKAWKTLGGHRRIDADSAEQLFKSQEVQIGAVAESNVEPRPQPDSSLAAGAASIAEAKAPASVCVVVVDDDAASRELMFALVRQALPDARVEVAENGFQALALIGKFKPDIVITDIHMPHMDGFEMVRQMMANEFMRPQTLIAVSASSPQELLALGEMPAEVQLLTKPLDPASMIATLRSAAGVG